MWPSFSLCAWRIFKIRSCLRMSLAPGRSSVRAILVSSVMFFSFSSAMVMVTYGIVLEGRLRFKRTGGVPRLAAQARGESLLCRLALGARKRGRSHQALPLGLREPLQDLVHGVLHPGVRTVELARRLRRHLAQQVAIGQVAHRGVN